MMIELRNISPSPAAIRSLPDWTRHYRFEMWIDGVHAFDADRRPAPSMTYSYTQLGDISIAQVDAWLRDNRPGYVLRGEHRPHVIEDEAAFLLSEACWLDLIRHWLTGCIVIYTGGAFRLGVLEAYSEDSPKRIRAAAAEQFPDGIIVNDIDEPALLALVRDHVAVEFGRIVTEANTALFN